MTAPLFVYNTTANSTWVEYDVEYEMAPNRIMEIQARFIPIILVAIPANLGIIAIILSTKTLRTKAFFLGVLSISVFDLCNGMFVLPMSLEHQLHWNEWPHGESVCIIFQVIAISKTYMSALMTTVLCFERLLAKLQSVATIDGQKVTTLSRVLIALPWCIGILVCVPLIMMNREDMSNHFTHDEYCLFVLENDFHLSILVMYLIPLGLLVLVPIAMMVVYKYKKSDWNRLSAETVEPEAVSLTYRASDSSISQLATGTGLTEMSTTDLPMTTSMFGYNTTVNSTWTVEPRNWSRWANEDSFAKEMKARFIPIILVAVPANLGIIAIILSNKRLRTHAFFLGILSISVFDLCHGVFVIPMGLEHMIEQPSSVED
ncbi:uncharacterized protein LOC110451392 [Mizuhopecten yessoensis]|uniref:uncharacterized protein LOC110451392 n=1 Tax=Mizuhopecten yessoensis TaxID=6573 RepID=UPI000B45B9BE|nr:uncharacterized protein LOC110451392 [Mizuhopecten yessoensis]